MITIELENRVNKNIAELEVEYAVRDANKALIEKALAEKEPVVLDDVDVIKDNTLKLKKHLKKIVA